MLSGDLVLVAQSCPTLCNPMDCSLRGSSVHRIFQTRILQWVAIPFFMGSSQPRDKTRVSHIAGTCFILYCLSHPPQFKNKGKTNNPTEKWAKTLNRYFSKYIVGGSDSKESACNAGNPGLIPGMGRSPGEGSGNPL